MNWLDWWSKCLYISFAESFLSSFSLPYLEVISSRVTSISKKDGLLQNAVVQEHNLTWIVNKRWQWSKSHNISFSLDHFSLFLLSWTFFIVKRGEVFTSSVQTWLLECMRNMKLMKILCLFWTQKKYNFCFTNSKKNSKNLI